MSHHVYINTTFTNQLVREVKQSLKTIPLEEKEIFVRINSIGGNVYAMNVISSFFYFMHKYRHCRIVTQAKHAESAGLLLFLNFPTRQVAPGSVGIFTCPSQIQR